MTATIKFNGGNPALLCNNCRKIIATGSNIPYNAIIKGLNSLWFCSVECAKEYRDKNGGYEYLCNIMEPDNKK